MPEQTITDEACMLRVKADDLDAMVPLYDRYHEKLYNFFMRLCRDGEKAKDLTQTIFSRMISYRHSFKEGHKFKSWMYQMARNALIDSYHHTKPETNWDPETEFVREATTDAADEFEKVQQEQTLMEAIAMLSEDEKQIIELSRFQDLKYEEIARITGSSEGAVRVKVHRAIKKLREIYFQMA